MLYKDWLKEWLTYYVRPTTKPRTYDKYSSQTRSYLIPRLGDIEIEQISPIRLQKFCVSLTENGLSSNTVNGIVTLLKMSLRCAAEIGKAKKEYGGTVIRPKVREKQINCFSKEEQRSIEQYVISKNEPRLAGIIIALYTGLRIGELLALRWEDIDLRENVLNVTKTCYDSWSGGRYKKLTDLPKTESSIRSIPLPMRLLPLMEELKGKTRGEYVVSGRTDYGASIRSYQRTFERLLLKLRIEHRGFHSLRHTFATRALEVGMDVKTLSEILGHKNPTITLKRYAHSQMKHKAEMMNKIGDLLL